MNHRGGWQPCWPYTPARETRGQPSIAPTMPTNTAQSAPAEPLKTADLPLHYAENGASWCRAWVPISQATHPFARGTAGRASIAGIRVERDGRGAAGGSRPRGPGSRWRSEEHTSELQSL